MRKRSEVLTSILASTLVVSACWMIYISQLNQMHRNAEVSNIVAPMSALITDLNETARRGENELLHQKLQALAQHWEAFRLGNERPDGFWKSITEIGAEDVTRKSEPAAAPNSHP